MEPLNEFQPLPMMKQVERWLLSEEEEMGMVSVVSDRVKDYETWLISDEEEMGMVSVVSDRVKDYETWLLSEEEEMGMVSVVSDRVKDYETWLISDEEEMGMVSVVSDRVKDYETWLLSEEEEMGMVSVVSDRVKDYETWLLEDEEKIPNMFPLDALKDSYISNMEPASLLTEEELPVGYRFKPTDRDLLIHYLGKRLTGGILRSKAVMDFNVYSREPWLLPGSDMIRSDVKASLYFFVAYPKTSENSSRAHRQAGNGFWKASTGDKEIRDDSLHHMRVIGYVKQLTYHLYVDTEHRSTNKALKTHWIMHELKLTKSPEMTICRIKMH